MRFSVTSVLALAASAFAQTADFDPVYTPTNGQIVPAGSTLKITWQAPAKYAGVTVSISLIGGATQNTQVPLETIATGVKNSAESYDWVIPTNLGDQAVYGLVFRDEADTSVFQYSMPFHIKPAGSSSQTGSATSTVTTSTGVKTVTLSSQTSTTAAAPSTTDVTVILDKTTTVPCYNSTTLATHTKTPHAPQTTIATPTQVVITSTAWAGPSNTTKPTVIPTVAPGAGAHVGASSLALVGGLVMAFLAL